MIIRTLEKAMRERTKQNRQVFREIRRILFQLLRKCILSMRIWVFCTMMCFHLVRVVLQFPGGKISDDYHSQEDM